MCVAAIARRDGGRRSLPLHRCPSSFTLRLVSSQPRAVPGSDDDAPASDADEVGRLRARVAQAEFERDLARDLRQRVAEELRRLDAKVGVLEGERAALRAQLDDRDRLLDVIFRSRSWRLMQALRRRLGRS